MSSESSAPSIADITGPLLVGQLFNWGLFGVLCLQATVYYLAFPSDKRFPTKILAWSIFIVEVIQVIISTDDSFRNFASAWGDPDELDVIGLGWFTVPILGSIVAAVTETFYAWRIWILAPKLSTRRRALFPALVVVVSLLQLGAGIGTGVVLKHAEKFSVMMDGRVWNVALVWLSATAACDLLIAVFMSYCFYHSASKRSKSPILKVMKWLIETNGLCAASAFIVLALFVAFPERSYHITPSFALSKFHSNSLFAVLNARIRIDGGLTPPMGTDETDLSLSNTIEPSTPPPLPWEVRSRQFDQRPSASLEFHRPTASMEFDDRPSGDSRNALRTRDVLTSYQSQASATERGRGEFEDLEMTTMRSRDID